MVSLPFDINLLEDSMSSSHPTVLTKYILTKHQKGERPAHPRDYCGLPS